MKCGLRFTVCAALLVCTLVYFLGRHLRDLGDQYRAGAYLSDWWYRNDLGYSRVPSPSSVENDKVIVMAKLEEERTDWVEEELPE